MFFAQRLILVEGLEDTAYLTAYLQLSGRWEDYRRLGCHMIPVGGKDQLIQPLAIAKALNIPTVVVFDSDADKYGTIDAAADPEGKLAARRPMHLRDNTAILKLCGITTPDPFPAEALFHDSVVLWHSEIGSVVEEDIGAQDWRECKTQAERELGQPGGLEKNVLQIALRLAKAWDAGKRSTHLDQACDRILNTARPAVAQPALQILTQAAQAHHAP